MPLSKWGAAAAGISQGLQNVAQIQRMGQVKRATEREEADYASKNAPVDFNEWSGRMGEDVRPIIQETAISLGVNPKQFTRADAEKVYTAINSERIAQRLSSIRRRTLSGQISAEPDPNRAIELQRQLEDLNNADKGYMEARRIAAIENKANQPTSPTVHKMYKTVNGIDMMSEDGGQTWGRRWNPKEGGGSGGGDAGSGDERLKGYEVTGIEKQVGRAFMGQALANIKDDEEAKGKVTPGNAFNFLTDAQRQTYRLVLRNAQTRKKENKNMTDAGAVDRELVYMQNTGRGELSGLLPKRTAQSTTPNTAPSWRQYDTGKATPKTELKPPAPIREKSVDEEADERAAKNKKRQSAAGANVKTGLRDIFLTTPKQRRDSAERELKAGIISKEQYDKRIREAEIEEKVRLREKR